MDKKTRDKYDPTGYYTRKHKREMEYADKVLIPFFKWALVLLAVVVVVELVRGCIKSAPAQPCARVLAN